MVKFYTSSPSLEERKDKIREFLKDHSIPDCLIESGMVYSPTPYNLLDKIFKILEENYGTLKNKRLLDLGAGDLRISLFANLYNMRVAAVEKNKHISGFTGKNSKDAMECGLIGKNLTLSIETDAFQIPWKDFDIIYFYYTEPGKREKRDLFRQRLKEKMLETNPGSILAILFSYGQIYHNLHNSLSLQGKFLSPAAIKEGSFYLQLYVLNKSRTSSAIRNRTVPIISIISSPIISRPGYYYSLKGKQASSPVNSLFGRGSWGNNRDYGRIYNEEAVRTSFAPIIEELKSIFGNLGGIRLLEIGCGTGNLLKYLVEEEYINVVGVEKDEETYKIAKEKGITVHLIKKTSDFKKYLQEEYFDVVITSFLLQTPTIKEREIAPLIKAANRYLRAGGYHIHAAAKEVPKKYFRENNIRIIKEIKQTREIYPYFHIFIGQ